MNAFQSPRGGKVGVKYGDKELAFLLFQSPRGGKVEQHFVLVLS